MNGRLRFADLFAGIGGFRLGFEQSGYECVFSAENNPFACKLYEMNFGVNPDCDITKLDASALPDFDVLCAGFPCQAFSICGKKQGFADETRGTLFFDVCRVLEEKRPYCVVLENVANLEKHDNGNTLRVILDSLANLGYTVTYRVLNARDFGVPQSRERIILIGCLDGKAFDFWWLERNPVNSMLGFLDTEGDFTVLSPDEYTLLSGKQIHKQSKTGLIFCGYRNKNLRVAGIRPNTEHLSRAHKQPNRIYDSRGIHPTLMSQESSGRYFIKVGDTVRKLTMAECFRFMGFPDDYKREGTDAQQYACIGNSICVPMVRAIADAVAEQIFGREVVI